MLTRISNRNIVFALVFVNSVILMAAHYKIIWSPRSGVITILLNLVFYLFGCVQGFETGRARGYIEGVSEGQNFLKNVLAAVLKSVEPAELMRETFNNPSNGKVHKNIIV